MSYSNQQKSCQNIKGSMQEVIPQIIGWQTKKGIQKCKGGKSTTIARMHGAVKHRPETPSEIMRLQSTILFMSTVSKKKCMGLKPSHYRRKTNKGTRGDRNREHGQSRLRVAINPEKNEHTENFFAEALQYPVLCGENSFIAKDPHQ